MALERGQSLSHYEILAPLGQGGMGEVYRARDSKLGREVAIKVLPADLAQDEDRLLRFEREARTLASLNHPNVAGIFGVDQAGDVCFLALELVPGQDLATRLERGALPVDEAIDICRQIAEGLEAAHEAGVVHRDLKPANVCITPEGAVKILDFGLAKPMHPKSDASGSSAAQSDSFQMTQEGVILGTPTYMSPEQARGKPVDRRTDIWAFGCVLFECLTGKRAFGGESLTDTLASIVGDDPNFSQLPAVSDDVIELLRRALTKDPRGRLRDIGEARVTLERAVRGPTVGAPAVRSKPRLPSLAWVALVLVLGGVLFGVGFATGRRDSVPEKPVDAVADGDRGTGSMHLQICTFEAGEDPTGFQISPDGRALAWWTADGIWVRRLEDLEPELVREGKIDHLAWSPDSSELIFLEDHATWRLPANGGRVDRVRGGAVHGRAHLEWLEDGRLLYGTGERVWTLPADGGDPTVVLELSDSHRFNHWHFLRLLPGGDLLGALHRPAIDFDSVEVFREGEPEIVLRVPGAELGEIVLSESNLLICSAKHEGESSLWSNLFSPTEARSIGEPQRFAKGSQPSVSRDGDLAYLVGESSGDRLQLAWLDLNEPRLTYLDEPREGLSGVILSPGGRQAAFGVGNFTRTTFWVHDLDRGVSMPVVELEGFTFSTIWLDEGCLAISSSHNPVVPQETEHPSGTYEHRISGRGEPKKLSEESLRAVSPDGQYLVYFSTDQDTKKRKFRIVEPSSEDESSAVLEFGDQDRFISFSPDGRWMLYSSPRSGTRQLYLSRFPGSGAESWSVCVAKTAGAWIRKDLSAIYYVTFDSETRSSRIYRVELSVEPEVKLGAPELVRQLEANTWIGDYDGGDRFLVTASGVVSETRAYLHTDWEAQRLAR